MKLSVFGASLEGMVLAACFADTGNDVVLTDPWHEANVKLPEQISDINEPGLGRLLQESMQAQRLTFVANPDSALSASIHIIAGRRLDTARIIELGEKIVWTRRNPATLVISAPLPLGALDEIQSALDRFSINNSLAKSDVIALPTFLREGSALRDFQAASVMVVGTGSNEALSVMQALLRPFLQAAGHPMFVDCPTAEFIRFSFSAMLATRLSLMNELACLAETMAVDIELVGEGLASDARIGSEYLQPGCGFGGGSLSRDVLSLNSTIKKRLDNSGLLDAVMAINESQKELLFRRLWRYFKTQLRGKTVAIWGAAFKPGTSSTENSPIHPLVESIMAQGAKLRVYDPAALDEMQMRYADRVGMVLVTDKYDAIDSADALVIVTAWNEFWNPDFERMKELLREPVIFDGRNIFEPEYVESLGFSYFGIGRGRTI